MGIVHADLKPDNIMFCSGLGNNHLVKIIDFGWAFRAKDAPTMRKKKFQAVPYRAPEVCWRGTVGHGLDVWALGCIMPEIVTGVKLFEAANERQLAALIVRALGVHEAPPMERLARHPISCDGDRTAALTDGWIRFRVSIPAQLRGGVVVQIVPGTRLGLRPEPLGLGNCTSIIELHARERFDSRTIYTQRLLGYLLYDFVMTTLTKHSDIRNSGM